MKNKNVGILFEEEIVIAINGKRYSELSNNMRNMVRFMFGHVDENSIIKCERLDNAMKPDVFITIDNVTHYLSVKTGANGIVHQELITLFVDHLRMIGISKTTIETILLYHYGDGTTDGTGKKRYPNKDVTFYLKKRIKAANEELNANRKFVEHIINRCLFKGSKDDNILAEYIYHGDIDYGVIASRNQILRHVYEYKYGFYDSFHIGPLLMHPHARYANKRIKNEKRRHTIEFHWPNYQASLRKIALRYNDGAL